MDKFAAMRAFVAIVDEGSLTAAAAAVGRAPPSMVRILATLEQELGVRLLHRTTRRMALTEEGRVYLDRCRRILADVEEVEHAIRADSAEPRGEIRATAPILFGQRHVVPATTEFLRRHPAVRVELLLLDRVVDLVEEGLDVGIRLGRLPDSSLVAVPVGEVRRVVVASPALLRRGVPRHPSELARSPCVEHQASAQTGRWSFRDGERDLSVRIQAAFACNQSAAIVEACAQGLGFARLLSYQVEPEVRAGALRVVLTDFEPPPLPVQIVYPGARLMSTRLRAFIADVGARLRERPELRRARRSAT